MSDTLDFKRLEIPINELLMKLNEYDHSINEMSKRRERFKIED